MHKQDGAEHGNDQDGETAGGDTREEYMTTTTTLVNSLAVHRHDAKGRERPSSGSTALG
jgi:hypothetical protein